MLTYRVLTGSEVTTAGLKRAFEAFEEVGACQARHPVKD